MRTSSKILAVLFLIVAGALFYQVTKKDEAQIQAAVDARADEATADRAREIEEQLAAREQELQETMAEREQALADTLARREQAVEERLAALDEALARVDDPVFERIDGDRMEQILTGMGLSYERTADDEGDPKFEFRLATYEVQLYFDGCETEGCSNLRIYAGFNKNPQPSTETLNEWNRTKRYATAYVSEGGTTGIDNDLVLEGGIRAGNVEDFIVKFRSSVGDFAPHIDF